MRLPGKWFPLPDGTFGAIVPNQKVVLTGKEILLRSRDGRLTIRKVDKVVDIYRDSVVVTLRKAR